MGNWLPKNAPVSPRVELAQIPTDAYNPPRESDFDGSGKLPAEREPLTVETRILDRPGRSGLHRPQAPLGIGRLTCGIVKIGATGSRTIRERNHTRRPNLRVARRMRVAWQVSGMPVVGECGELSAGHERSEEDD